MCVFLLLSLFGLSNCSETLINNVEKKSSIEKRASILSAAQPEVLATESFLVTPLTRETGPFVSDIEIHIDDFSNVMVAWDFRSWETAGEFPPHFLYRDATATTWQDSAPIPPALLGNVDEISVFMQRQSGDMYVSWTDICDPDCSNVYSNRFEPVTGWEAETLHGLGKDSIITMETQDNATIIWQNVPTATSALSFSAQPYEAGVGWGLSQVFETKIEPIAPPEPPPIVPEPPVTPEPTPTPAPVSNTILSNNASQSFFNVAVDTLGTNMLVWNYYNDSTSNNAYQYGSAEFSATEGWHAKQLTRFSNGVSLGGTEIIIAAGETANTFEVVADSNITDVSGFDKSQLQASTYLNGEWARPKNIKSNGLTFYSTSLPYVAKSNKFGDIAITWLEYDGVQTNLYANLYLRKRGWVGAQKIYGPVLDTTLSDTPVIDPDRTLDKLAVSINDNGSAVVSWMDNASIDRRILLSKYDGISGWRQAALVAQIDGRSDYIDSLDVNLSSDDRVFVIWNQVTLVAENWQSSIILSEDDYAAFPIAPLSAGVRPNTPLLPVQSINWSEATKLWGESTEFDASAYTTAIRMEPSDRPLVTFEYYSGFNEQVNEYEIEEVHLIAKDPQNSVWQNVKPAITSQPNGPIKIAFNANSKNSYAIFRSHNIVFINRKRQNLNWSEEQSAYSDQTGDYDVYALQNAGAIITSLPSAERNSISFREVQYIAGSPQISPADEQSVANARIIGDSVINGNDQVFTLWLISQENIPGEMSYSLQMSVYDVTNGWDASSASLPIDTINQAEPILMAVNKLNEPIVIAVTNTGTLSSNLFSLTTGFGNWVNVDNNDTSGDIIMGHPDLANNASKDIMAIWTEEEITATGAAHVIYTALLNDPVDGQPPSWAAPEQVATTKHPAFQQSAKLFLADNGNAVAYWPLSLLDRTVVLANKYIANTGWNANPDEIRSYLNPDFPLVVINNMSATINRDEITVSWMERNLYNDKQMSLWTSSSGF